MKVVTAPDQKLRIKTKKVKKITPQLLKLAEEMIKLTKTFKDPEGVGLATTQIGRDEAMFVGKFGKDFVVCFNPEIISTSEKTKVFFEGCLSIPNIYGEVTRPISIEVKYQDEKGETIKKRLHGLSAWIFQHEVDHLNGGLFMDKVLTQKGKIYKSAGRDRTGTEIFEEIVL